MKIGGFLGRCGARWPGLAGAAMLILAGAGAGLGGTLEMRGQVHWSPPLAEFGGLSGIEMAPDGTGLHVISDRGHLFTARTLRDGAGDLTGLTITGRTPLYGTKGEVPRPFLQNAEALAMGDGSGFFVAYEAWPRVWRYDRPGAVPAWTHAWDRFWHLLGNDGLEALALDPVGRLMAISGRPDGTPPGFAVWVHDGTTTWTGAPPFPARDGFTVSGADFGPDGALYLLERRFRWYRGFATRIRRLDLDDGRIVAETRLLDSPPGALDNSEGISVWRDARGGLRLTLVSDDNFNPLQRTLVTEFLWTP